MRILQIGPVTPELGGRDTGGIATHLHGLAVHLAERGHDVGVVADNRVHDAAAWPAVDSGVSVFGIADFAGVARIRALASPQAIASVLEGRRVFDQSWSSKWIASKVAAYRSAIRTFRPDIVHVHTLEARYALTLAVLGDTVPIVATVHSSHYIEFADEARRGPNTRLVARNLDRAEHLIFVSDFLKHRYAALFPAAPERLDVQVIANPVDVARYQRIDRRTARKTVGIGGDGRVLLFVGNLIARKDPASLVRAVSVLARRGVAVTALLVGAGPEEAALRELAATEGVSDAVRFDGRRNQAELSAYYSAADLFVFPSLMESFGLVAVEAMLCGAPVVGTPEVFTEVVPEFCGSIAPASDPAGLAEAVADALSRPWDHDAIRAHARGFDWHERVRAFEVTYERILAAR